MAVVPQDNLSDRLARVSWFIGDAVAFPDSMHCPQNADGYYPLGNDSGHFCRGVVADAAFEEHSF